MLNFTLLRLVACCFFAGAALGGCQRASYAFQPAPGYAPRTETQKQPETVAAADLPAAAVAPIPQASRRPGQRHPARHRWLSPVARRAAPGQRVHQTVFYRLLPTHTAARPTASASMGTPEPAPVRYRSKGIALLFAVLGGYFGLHRFYLGYPGEGAGYLGLLVAGYVFLVLGALLALGSGGVLNGPLLMALAINSALFTWLVIDIVRIAMGRLKPKNGEYNPEFFQTRPGSPPPPATR